MNSLFKSLFDAVVVNTNRPHLAKETKQAIITATLELHNRGRFLADVRDVVLTSTNGGITRYKFNIPKERLIRQIVNVAPVSPLGKLGIRIPQQDLFSEPTCGNWYSWYSETLTINVSHPANTFQLKFLSFPQADEANYSSWIAQRYPHFVTDLATFQVLVAAGQVNAAGIYKGLVGEARVPGTHIFNLLQENTEIN